MTNRLSSGGLTSYSMPQGDKRGATYEFYDWSYDGEWIGNNLMNGLGALVDGDEGPDDYKMGYYPKGIFYRSRVVPYAEYRVPRKHLNLNSRVSIFLF